MSISFSYSGFNASRMPDARKETLIWISYPGDINSYAFLAEL
jgi:hypothetical protein